VAATLPPYFDGLLAARRAGQVGRHVHLGYWDDPPSLATPVLPEEFERAQARLTEKLLDLVPIGQGQSVLDVACGFGGTLAAIDTRWHRLRLTGLNIDRRQLALCRGAVTGRRNHLALVAADAVALPFPDRTFDHVLCIEAAFHFPSRTAFLRETARVLRPGGTVALTDILLRRPAQQTPWDAGSIETIVRRDYGPWPEPWASLIDLERDADLAGLELTHRQDWSAATLPSYRTVAPLDPRPGRPIGAGDLLRWLHSNGCLTYPALWFRRR